MVDGLVRLARVAVSLEATSVLLIFVPDRTKQPSIDEWMARATDYASNFRVPPKVLIIKLTDFS